MVRAATKQDVGYPASGKGPEACCRGTGLDTLRAVFCDAVETVPALRSHFAGVGEINEWRDWGRLPITSAEFYAGVDELRNAVRSIEDMCSPVAPLSLEDPNFPLAVPQSYRDTLVLSERIAFVLAMADSEKDAPITLAFGAQQRYAASDLSEFLIFLGHTCYLLAIDSLSAADICAAISRLDSPTLFWMSGSLPPTRSLTGCVESVLTFNQHLDVHAEVRQTNILHLDAIPYLAASSDGLSYVFDRTQFHVDVTPTGEILLTTLRHDLFPLIRYRTGIRASLAPTGPPAIQGPRIYEWR